MLDFLRKNKNKIGVAFTLIVLELAVIVIYTTIEDKINDVIASFVIAIWLIGIMVLAVKIALLAQNYRNFE